ncbi:response regulator [Sphingomonas panni]
MVAACLRPAVPDPGALRVMIVDDSAVTRCVITRIVDAIPDCEVLAAVGGIAQAQAVLRDHVVDLILLDINLPGIDGLSGLPALFALAPDARVIILSGSCAAGSPTALHAMSLGAAATLAKPESSPLAGGSPSG